MTYAFAPTFRQNVVSDMDPSIMFEVTRVRSHLHKIRQEMGLRPLPEQEPHDPTLYLEMAKLWMPEIFKDVEIEHVPSSMPMTNILLPPNVNQGETHEDIFVPGDNCQTLKSSMGFSLPHPKCVPSRIFGISPMLQILPSGTGSVTPLCLKWYQDVHEPRPLDHIPYYIIGCYLLSSQGESIWSRPFNVPSELFEK